MYIVHDPIRNHLPCGGAQHAICFIDKIQPNQREKVMALQPRERVRVNFQPVSDRQGYEVEVYRCPGR